MVLPGLRCLVSGWHFYTCPEDALDNRNGLGTPQVRPPTLKPWVRSDTNHHEEVPGQSADGPACLALAYAGVASTRSRGNRRRWTIWDQAYCRAVTRPA